MAIGLLVIYQRHYFKYYIHLIWWMWLSVISSGLFIACIFEDWAIFHYFINYRKLYGYIGHHIHFHSVAPSILSQSYFSESWNERRRVLQTVACFDITFSLKGGGTYFWVLSLKLFESGMEPQLSKINRNKNRSLDSRLKIVLENSNLGLDSKLAEISDEPSPLWYRASNWKSAIIYHAIILELELHNHVPADPSKLRHLHQNA